MATKFRTELEKDMVLDSAGAVSAVCYLLCIHCPPLLEYKSFLLGLFNARNIDSLRQDDVWVRCSCVAAVSLSRPGYESVVCRRNETGTGLISRRGEVGVREQGASFDIVSF